MSKSRTPRRYQAVKRTTPKRSNRRMFSVTLFVLFVVSLVMGVNLYNLNAKPAPVVAQEPTPTPMPDVQIAPQSKLPRL